jgi:zinc protease
VTARPAGLFVERATDAPLVWFRIAALGGSAADPAGLEGLSRHASLLARRGAGDRDRAAFDDELDGMGASLDLSTSRDAITLSGLCLARHIDRVIELAADILAAPRMEQAEHDRLLRETRAQLDDLRDDDGEVADRHFAHMVAPGSPYARTAMGNEASLSRIDLDRARAVRAAQVVPRNLVIGFAGAIDDDRAAVLADRLVARLPDREPPPPPDIPPPRPASGRRLFLIDKPGRVQSQVRIGHPSPAYATDDFRALTAAEIIFGGTFSSRLMQEIRVARGWSYGAGCSLGRARGAHWLTIALAPAADVTARAAGRALEMFEELVDRGITADELDFARSHLLGSMPFFRATAAQRMRLAVRNRIFGLPAGFQDQLPDRLRALDADRVNAAIRAHFRPEGAVTVVVATAESMAPLLDGGRFGPLETIPHDAY